ncbi:hypothetical protein FACS1894219_02520 [Clostridia bacterium]|nr:hypothetical protein FACS1894219_02520 [Clostridia bacterium]
MPQEKIRLVPHDNEFETAAKNEIVRLTDICRTDAPDSTLLFAGAEHIGSTALKLETRPDIDIVVGVSSFPPDARLINKLYSLGYVRDGGSNSVIMRRAAADSISSAETFTLYIIKHLSRMWYDCLIFRDSLATSARSLREYENLKRTFWRNESLYQRRKIDFFKSVVIANYYNFMLGRTVLLKVRKRSVNAGILADGQQRFLTEAVLPGIKTREGTPQTALIISESPVVCAEFGGSVTAYAGGAGRYTKNLIVTPHDMRVYHPEIKHYLTSRPEVTGKYGIIHTTEQKIMCLYEKSCGAVLFSRAGGEIKFLLVRGSVSGHRGFPKGHVEFGESEYDTARREIFEETSIENPRFIENFREEHCYTVSGVVSKTVVLFLAEFLPESEKFALSDPEISELKLLSFAEAMEELKFPRDREILTAAAARIGGNQYASSGAVCSDSQLIDNNE